MRSTQQHSNQRTSQPQARKPMRDQDSPASRKAGDPRGDRSDEPPRDAQGRFVDDEDRASPQRQAGSRQQADDQPRDAQGRFKDEDSRGSRRSSH